ncbi:MAG: helix-turn-helix transcriptional regulator [Firmicutes bacterium]|nr:helix-turn-helix transcriptional regulator [Bacillota bacterium]
MQDALELVAILTPRELEVLVAIWQNKGCSAGELAKILLVTEACVRFHLHNIYQKLGVNGKAKLLLLCTDTGFGRVAETLSRSRDKKAIDERKREAVQENIISIPPNES